MVVVGVSEETAQRARLCVADRLTRAGYSSAEIIDTLEMLGIMPDQIGLHGETEGDT